MRSLSVVAESKRINYSPKQIFKEFPLDDPVKGKPVIELAERTLGWKPKVGLEEGLERTIDYFGELLKKRQDAARRDVN